MIFSFHPEAEAEFNDAIDYYEDKERGLGYDFAASSPYAARAEYGKKHAPAL